MPLLRRHLTVVRQFTVVVQCLLVDNVQHDFRIDVAAHGTGTGFGVGIVGGLLEISDGINGVTVEYGISAPVEQPQSVEELIDVAGRLVDVDDDEFSLQRLFLQEVDDLLGVSR